MDEPFITCDDNHEKSLVIFKCHVNRSGEYDVTFRVFPAWINESHYTPYEVFHDGKRVGTLTPHKEGWQNLHIDHSPTVELSEGTCWFIVSLPYGLPINVEAMYVKENCNVMQDEHTDLYEEYLEECRNEKEFDFMSLVKESLQNDLFDDEIQDLPLRYTFHAFMELKKDEELSITSYANQDFAIDVVYWGYSKLGGIIIKPGVLDIAEPNDFVAPTDPIEDPLFVRATDAEKAGLTWTGISITNTRLYPNLWNKYIQKYIRVPKDGRYYLRVRSLSNDKKGTANVVISSKSYNATWKEVPFSSSFTKVYFSRGVDYTAYTKVNDSINDKPIMFFQMYLGDQIQNYTDRFKVSSKSPQYFGLSKADVGLSFRTSYPIGILSVNNMNSTVPESKYDLTYFQGSYGVNGIRRRKKAGLGGEARGVKMQSSQSRMQLSGNTVVIRGESYLVLTVYDIKGRILFTQYLPYGEDLRTITLDKLGIAEPGVYILTLQDGQEIQTIKVII